MIFRRKKKAFDSLISELKFNGAIIGENVDIIDCGIDFIGLPLLKIGNNTTLTGCRLLMHDASTKKFLNYTKVGGITIGNNCFIGAGSIILPDTEIGDNVIVGAGTIVAKSVPSGVVICGNPFRVLCTTEEYLNRQKKNMNQYPVFDCYFKDLNEEQVLSVKKINKCFIR